MVNNLLRQNNSNASGADGETVDALVEMLRRNGIDPGKIDALISKASYPAPLPVADGANTSLPARGRASRFG